MRQQPDQPMNTPSQPSHRTSVDEPGLLLNQCRCCGEIELCFKGVAMALNLTHLYALVTRLNNLPTAPRYVVGGLNVRETAVRAGFQAIGLHLVCLRLDTGHSSHASVADR